jgi:predicted secreted Zn-dependent protease
MTMRMIRLAVVPAVSLALGACATSGAPAATSTGAGSAAVAAADQDGRRAPAYEQRFLAATRPNPPGVRLRVTVFETSIGGATRREFTENLRARQEAVRGRRDGAQQLLSSRWNMRWDWQTVTTSRNYCAFRTVTVFLDYQAHYVRMSGPLAEDPVAQEWWTTSLERTVNRHLVHVKELRDAAGETQKKLRDMTATACDVLTRDANRVASRDLQAIADRLGMTVYDNPPGGP